MKTRFIVLALVLATALPALAAAAEDWDGLKADYTQLRTYMSSKRRIGPAERTALGGLLERLDAFIAANPDDRRALAMDISVATWLGRTERVERDYEMLAQLTDADAVWLAWAKMRLAENRYDDAGAMARSRPYDLAETPEIAIIDARSRMSRNEFQAAIDAIDAIPETGLAKPGIRATANRYRGLGDFCRKYDCNPSTTEGQLRYMFNEYQWTRSEPIFKTPGQSIAWYTQKGAYPWLGWGIHGNRTRYAHQYYAQLT